MLRLLRSLLIAMMVIAVTTPATCLADPEFTSFEELTDKRVGILTGTPFDDSVLARNPDIEILYYTTLPDMIMALKSHKIDACAANIAVATFNANKDDELEVFPTPFYVTDIGLAFSKDSALYDSWDRTIKGLVGDGTSDRLWDKWTDADEAAKTMPEQTWPGTNGTVRVASVATQEPVCYMGDGGLLGFEPEMILAAAKRLDVHIEFIPAEFNDLLASIEAHKVGFGHGSLFITDERKQSYDFVVTHANGMTLLVREVSDTATAHESPSFLDGLATSFNKTFIVEGRWKLILFGLGVTCLIFASSAILGTALGFATTILRNGNNKVAMIVVDAFEGLMGRLPIVVVLMVFYYVIFGSIDISGTLVAAIVFTLSFGASAGSIMWNAVCAVDAGQREASLALGFTEQETFHQVVLPTAARRFLPTLSGQLVSLVKETSIVGYISVIDLTRATDLIRSRTMEAFFPLISSAAIYFALCCAVAAIVSQVISHVDLERRPRRIEGVGKQP